MRVEAVCSFFLPFFLLGTRSVVLCLCRLRALALLRHSSLRACLCLLGLACFLCLLACLLACLLTALDSVRNARLFASKWTSFVYE